MNNTLGPKKDEDSDDLPGEEIIVPVKIKPYINKEITFNFFIEMLTERLDPQRILITKEQFCNINFTVLGYPHFILKIMSVFTGKTIKALLRMKVQTRKIPKTPPPDSMR